jgi:hypothetical protein
MMPIIHVDKIIAARLGSQSGFSLLLPAIRNELFNAGVYPAYPAFNKTIFMNSVRLLQMLQGFFIQSYFEKSGPAKTVIPKSFFCVNHLRKSDALRNGVRQRNKALSQCLHF